jgi:hypothetical protein
MSRCKRRGNRLRYYYFLIRASSFTSVVPSTEFGTYTKRNFASPPERQQARRVFVFSLPGFMGPFLVVQPQPILCNSLHFREGFEQVEVQYIFPVGLVESLNVRVLCGLIWEMNSNATPFFSTQSGSGLFPHQ